MKTAKLIQLERNRLDLISEARSIAEELNDATDDKTSRIIEQRHQKAMRDLDTNQLDIEEEKLSNATEESRASQRPVSDAIASASGFPDYSLGATSTEWRAKDGSPVRVLRPNETMAERSNNAVSVGDVIRARITGPRNEQEVRALSEGVDSAGGFTVPTPLAHGFIDIMRAKTVVSRAGASTVPMDSETLAMARLVSDPEIEWRGENAPIVEGDPTFDRVTFTARTLAGMLRLSRELVEDSINVGAMIQNALAQSAANKLDEAALWGSGTGFTPRGVANTAGINTLSMGTNGAAIADYDRLIDAVHQLQLANAGDPTAMIMHPRTIADLAKLKDGDGTPLTTPGLIAGIPRLGTTAAPIDETEGTGDDASSIILGDFSHLMIGMRTRVEIRVFDSPLASTGQLLVVAWMRADVQLAQPKSFCRLKGILSV
jgi:HK97 family phage major capsid protein